MTLLTGVGVLLSAFLIVDGISYIALISIMVIFMTATTAPQRYIDSVRNSVLGKAGLILGFLTFLTFARYIALERTGNLIAAAIVYLLFSLIISIFALQQTAKARLNS